MRLLYLSSHHGTLEYDEISLFTELGIDVFSTGIYIDPQNPLSYITTGDGKRFPSVSRPPINVVVNQDILQEFQRLNPNHEMYKPVNVDEHFINHFDVIVSSYCPAAPYFIHANWDLIKHKNVIWRSYTQHSPKLETTIQPYRKQGLKIVHMSARERTMPGCETDDGVIRHYVDENEYGNWNGESQSVLTFASHFSGRAIGSNTVTYKKIRAASPYEFQLYGYYNEDVPECLGTLAWAEQKEKYRRSRMYFALGSKPSSLTYTLVEAMMTGCPIITWGSLYGNVTFVDDWANKYEVPDIIQSGKNGFYFDDPDEITKQIKMLMNDYDLAKEVGAAGRETAISLFGKSIIKKQWAEFLSI
jgi:hypothetical protein